MVSERVTAMLVQVARRPMLALGAVVLLWIAVGAVWRGQQVAWKGRRYSPSPCWHPHLSTPDQRGPNPPWR